ncbi:MAG: RNA-binding protein [Candidatus Altiarchaeales archaeon HGW-Altiarchaeales-3]|nr:MAG: RNA-binding protein [Candidatus Altiarchaeales archaeon HGW-Altiarchaeales-3]
MSKISDREIVLPGQMLGQGVLAGTHCFKEGKSVVSSVRGLARMDRKFAKVVAFDGKYMPKKADVVVGVIEGYSAGGWFIDINSGYSSYMRGEEVTRRPLDEDLKRYYSIGDCFTAKVIDVDEVYNSTLINPWKLKGGMIINISPKKVPRVIGKGKSMINMLRDKIGCKIIVGQNGRVWLSGNKIEVINYAIKTIRTIEKNAHKPGLTTKIEALIDKELNKR